MATRTQQQQDSTTTSRGAKECVASSKPDGSTSLPHNHDNDCRLARMAGSIAYLDEERLNGSGRARDLGVLATSSGVDCVKASVETNSHAKMKRHRSSNERN